MKLPHRRQFLHLAAGAAALPAMSRIARAQAYPTRPVRLVVGYAPGGAGDISTRLLGQWLSERLGQQFIIENRTGAGTNIATESVVRAAADGYTLLMSSAANGSTRRSMIDSTSISSVTPRQSPALCACRMSSWFIHRFRPKLFQSSSPMQKPIRASSHGLRPALERQAMFAASYSR